MEREIKKLDIFYYHFSEGENRWNKHGILVAHRKRDGKWRFNDTYWRQFLPDGEYGWYEEDDVKEKITYFGNVKRIKEVSEHEAEHYEPKDILFIPIGGRSDGYYVRKSAKKNKHYMIRQLIGEIKGLKGDIDRNIRKIVDKEKALDKIKI